MPGRRRDGLSDPLSAIGCTEAVPIASGGSSMVYRARQEEFDRLIAVKVLTMPVIDDRARRRFQRELAIAGRLTGHPNVVTVFASGFLPDGRGYVQMEYCPGGSLADRLIADGVLPVQDVVNIGVKLCGVLELAAREGIVHRDVKPANILITRFGEPALSDFGIAVLAGERTATTNALTPSHAAPEVLESRPAGPPADQWSLASTLHTLLSGRPPFAGRDGEGMLAGMLRVLSDPVPVIPRSDVPVGLQRALERAMAKPPPDRWPSAGDFGRELQSVERESGWPVTRMPVDEVPEARLTPVGRLTPVQDVTGPGLRHQIRSGSPNHQVAPPPGSDPSFVAGPPSLTGSPSLTEPPSPTEPPSRTGSPSLTGSPSRTEPPSTTEPPSLTGSPSTTEPPSRTEPRGEQTRHWSWRPAPPIPDEVPAADRSKPWVWIAAAGGVIVVAVVIALVSLTGSPRPKVTSHTPRLQTPSAALAAALAPRHVEVVNEQPTSVTIQWVDPSHGVYPFVVRVSTGAVQTALSHTQAVVTGLDPAKGYCFVVGAVYGVGGQVANAAPVCVRGGTT